MNSKDARDITKTILMLAFLSCLSTESRAQENKATVLAPNEYNLFYTDASGSRIDAKEALIKSVQGTKVFKCQSVEPTLSKSQTSISLRNTKKPKSN